MSDIFTDLIISVAEEDILAAATLRKFRNAKIAEYNNLYWIKGRYGDREVQKAFAECPAVRRYRAYKNELTEFGNLLKSLTLPELNWMPLHEFFIPVVNSTLIPAQFDEKIPILLDRSTEFKEPGAMICKTKDLKQFIDYNGTFTFEHLMYSVCKDQCFIIGKPLPAVKGELFYQEKQLFMPIGWGININLVANYIKLINIKPQDFAVVNQDNSWDYIEYEDLHYMTRSSVRELEDE